MRVPVKLHPSVLLTTPSDIWVNLSNQLLAVLATSDLQTSQKFDTGPLALRMRYQGENRDGLIDGVIVQKDGQLTFETELDVYLDAPYLNVRLSGLANTRLEDNLRSYPINGLKLSTEDFQPVTAYQVSLKGVELLAVIPAATTIVAGSLGAMPSRPAWGSIHPSKWIGAYALDFAIFSLAPFFLASFAPLSALPSLAADVPRYDAHLGFSVLALDIRLIVFLGFIASRLWLIGRKQTNVTALDGLNFAALAYGFALYALVGLEGSNYMSLPIQFVAVLDILMIF